MMDQNLRAARSDAHTWQADARSRLTDPPTADDLDRARLEQLGQTCPGAQMAGAVLSITGWPPVAIDPDRPQEPSSGPLTTPGEVWHHYRHRNADGAGLRLGSQPGGVSLVAVHGTAKAWSDWYAEHAVEASKARYEDGSGKVTSYRDAGRFTRRSAGSPRRRPSGRQGSRSAGSSSTRRPRRCAHVTSALARLGGWCGPTRPATAG